MPNNIAAEGRLWTPQRTLSGSDSPNAANYGACWQSSADRDSVLYRAKLLDAVLASRSLGTDCPYGVVENTTGNGYLYGLKATTGRLSFRAITSFSDSAYPGGVATPLTAVAQCCSENEANYPVETGGSYVVIDDNFHTFTTSLQTGEATGITVGPGLRLLHRVASGYMVIGGTSGGSPVIRLRSSGAVYSNATITNSPSGSPDNVQCIAKSGDGEMLAVLQSSTGDLLYSSDHGQNWTYYQHDIGAVCQAVSYDAEHGLWVAIRSDNGTLYTTADPTSGTWTAEGTTAASPRDMICYGPLRLVVGSTGTVKYYHRQGSGWTGLNGTGLLSVDALVPLASRLALVGANSYITGAML